MSTNAFPSDTMTNPRGKCKAITLRSGKVVKEASSSHNLQEEEATNDSEIKEGEEMHIPSPPKQVLKPYLPKVPYPQRLRKDGKDSQFSRFLEVFKKLQINIPFAEALEQMPLYAKFLKELMTKKRNWGKKETVVLTEEYSINLISLAMMKRMRIEEAKLTRMALQLADRTFKFPHRVVEDFLVKVGEFIFPADFVVLDMEEEANTSIILGRPFLATAGAIIDVQKGELVLRLHEKKIVFNVFTAISYPKEFIGECMMVDTMEKLIQGVLEEDQCEDAMEQEQQTSYGELPQEIIEGSIMLDKTNKEKVEEPKLELKTLPPSLKYAYLGSNDTYPVIINSSLNEEQEEELIKVLRQHKDAIG
ncbi:uncharacterized protein LOC107615673 [Arachis ipaensis]|uniref:uncharacterized protein LOC107615673 n=1 Tax=Arachis ipaensis TaxID=130454 RepID=UPI0007AFDA8F|nr:uncharacterized protein LOC107615673 [Arachis ipaensis]XP_025678643.1 uncharacterized protein LOC112778551 [Arachis hypogaea]